MRLFTAIPVPENVRESIILGSAPLRGAYPDLRWVGMDALHITLMFLGEVREALVDPLCQVLREVVPVQSPFRIVYRGLGSFPRKGKPRVVYLHIAEGISECRKVHEALTNGIGRIVEADRRNFIPHLTIARNKDSRIWPDVMKEGKDIAASFIAETVVLYRSHLKPNGAEYEELCSVPLTGRKKHV